MIDQLAVYDENGTQIGMTFPKRARQLISKQRAVWHDDAHTAIRLLPEPKEEASVDDYLDDVFDDSPPPAGSDDLLLYLARKNVQEKRNLTRHVIAYILAWPVVAIIYAAVFENTRHPAYWRWRSNFIWALEDIRSYLPEESSWLADNVYRNMSSIVRNLTHPAWHYIICAMLIWGGWITCQAIKRSTRLRAGRTGRVKPDPVQQEYQRLKDMAGVKY